MSIAKAELIESKAQGLVKKPVVIIGTGPVGVRIAQTLIREKPDQEIIIYGNEPWEPYNRVQLCAFFAGELDWFGLVESQRITTSPNVTLVQNCAVTDIDRENCNIYDENQHVQAYDKLVIATGSTPHIPSISGVDKRHIYCFRNLTDIEKLSARRVRSRRTVVIGGGLLGLEAARAMQRQHTEVVVIDHNSHLMSQQLDEQAAEFLREKLLVIDIRIQLGVGVAEFTGEDTVTGVKLRNGKIIDCDTVILAAGIRPNIELARKAKLHVGQGIRVNDRMQTSDPNIYAAGECAEHRGTIYGLIAPGYEQAGVLVNSLLDRKSRYQGSIAATRLKVVGEHTFSMGDAIIEDDPGHFYEQIVFTNHTDGLYRKLVIKNGRLVGSVAIGEWSETARIQEAIAKKARIWPWQTHNFRKTGLLWPNQKSKSVSQWPASTRVCQCMGVSRGQLSKVISDGHCTIAEISKATGAATVCGTCKPLLADLLGANTQMEKIGYAAPIFIISILSFLLSVIIFTINPVPYNDSVVTDFAWDILWRDKTIKQITGFGVLGLSVVGMIISLQKRTKSFRFLSMSALRYTHIMLGILGIVVLVAHSGFRLGENLNQYLMIDFIALLLIGSLTGAYMSTYHRDDAMRAMRVKKFMLWSHILLVWPLPVLLGFHILQTYYF